MGGIVGGVVIVLIFILIVFIFRFVKIGKIVWVIVENYNKRDMKIYRVYGLFL